MKNHLPFDQHFKNQLEDVESFVPDNMFENIMAERKRRRGFALFFQNNSFKFGLTACAVLAGAGLLFLKSNPKTVQQPITSVTAPSKIETAIVASTPSLTTIDALTNYTPSKPKALKSNVLDKMSIAQTTEIDIEPAIVTPTNATLQHVNQAASQLNIAIKNIDVVENQPIAQANHVDTQVNQRDNQAVAQMNPDVTQLNQVDNQAVTQVHQTEGQEAAASSQDIKPIDKPRVRVKSPLAHLPTKKAHLVQGQVKASDVKSTFRLLGPEINCPNFNLRKPSRWYVDIWGSPDYALRKLYNNKGENTLYVNTRDSVEKSWYAVSAGARLSVVLESGVAVRAGLNYLQNNEVFDYKKPGEVRTITITESVKQPNGTTITSTRTEKQYGTYQLKKYNRYRSIDLPIQLGYEFGRMPWSYSVNGGINFNLTSWRKAQILSPALAPFDASKKDANVFKSNVGASLYASFAAYYDWKSYTQFFVEPYIRHFLSPITTKDYLLEQRYTDVGLKLGVRWRL